MRNIERDALPTVDTSSDDNLCRPDCEHCGGIGWIRHDLPWSHPLFGKVQLCPNVDRWKLPFARNYGITEQESKALQWSGIVDIGEAKRAVQLAIKMMNRGYGWLFLYGGNGLAKTTILKTAVATAIRGGSAASYARMASIIDHMRAAFDSDAPSIRAEERLDWWAEVPVLGVDEFDRFRPTEFARERAFLLFDRRYEEAVAKRSVTIFASNESPLELPPYLADRIYDGRFEVLALTGDSFRAGMQWTPPDESKS